MFIHEERALRALGFAAVLASVLPTGCAPVVEDGNEAGEEPVEALAQALTTATSGLSIAGSSSLTPLAAGDGYAHVFDGAFRITNTTGKAVTIQKQLFFFAAPGGFAFFSPSFDRWWPALTASSAPVQAGPFGWGFTAPVDHLVVRVDGKTSSGTAVAAQASVPVIAAGKTPPGTSTYSGEVGVGVFGPLALVNLTSGQRWIDVSGTVVDMTRTATAPPVITVTARNAAGSTVATFSKMLAALEAPIQRFTAWAPIPAGASVASVRIVASQAIAGKTASQTVNLPVASASPLAIASPVAGTWAWDNGPGQGGDHAHSFAAEGRYGYDLCIKQMIDGELTPVAGDRTVNANWFCWRKPIRAAQGGTVRFVVDHLPDNNGDLHDNDQGNNEVIVEHPNGIFSRYAHLRQGSATVAVGQVVAAGTVIGEVGNSGGTSGPHLHFHVFKIDASGRQAAVPVTVNGMKTTGGVGVAGVPRAPTLFQTP